MTTMPQSSTSPLHTYYKLLFLYIEPLLLVISTTIYLLAPSWTSHTLFASFIELIVNASPLDTKHTHPASQGLSTLDTPLTYLLIGYFFNMTCIAAGLQYRLLPILDYNYQQWFIFCLAYGDIGHLFITYYHIFILSTSSLNPINWPIGVYLNIVTTVVLFVSRVGWYVGGRRYDLRYETVSKDQ